MTPPDPGHMCWSGLYHGAMARYALDWDWLESTPWFRWWWEGRTACFAGLYCLPRSGAVQLRDSAFPAAAATILVLSVHNGPSSPASRPGGTRQYSIKDTASLVCTLFLYCTVRSVCALSATTAWCGGGLSVGGMVLYSTVLCRCQYCQLAEYSAAKLKKGRVKKEGAGKIRGRIRARLFQKGRKRGRILKQFCTLFCPYEGIGKLDFSQILSLICFTNLVPIWSN